MIEKKAGLDNIINNDNDNDIEGNDANDADDAADDADDAADDADDERSFAESDIRSINAMIYDDVESVIDIKIGEEETNKLNNNKLNDKNKINYFNDYILAPIHVIYDYCKILYNYINIF
jgi:U3 small nucleolar RNA-associated protein 14